MLHIPVHRTHMKSHRMNSVIDTHIIHFLHRKRTEKNRTVWTGLYKQQIYLPGWEHHFCVQDCMTLVQYFCLTNKYNQQLVYWAVKNEMNIMSFLLCFLGNWNGPFAFHLIVTFTTSERNKNIRLSLSLKLARSICSTWHDRLCLNDRFILTVQNCRNENVML